MKQDIGQTYRETGARGAAPLSVVVMLYDVLLDDLRRAIAALQARDIETRAKEIQHAMQVLEQLQGSLDMERGGDTARNLDDLYSLVRGKLIEAHWKSSEELLSKQIELMIPVRDAWKKICDDQGDGVPIAQPPAMQGEWRA